MLFQEEQNALGNKTLEKHVFQALNFTFESGKKPARPLPPERDQGRLSTNQTTDSGGGGEVSRTRAESAPRGPAAALTGARTDPQQRASRTESHRCTGVTEHRWMFYHFVGEIVKHAISILFFKSWK